MKKPKKQVLSGRDFVTHEYFCGAVEQWGEYVQAVVKLQVEGVQYIAYAAIGTAVAAVIVAFVALLK